ncbi:hypothetical protein K2F54_09795 [Cryobacterium sp. 1639]|uniref:hypothetical protein n=1 Tax=Cryobacterium inferilacus TaxID=2866629 RepID=UPI001C72AF86|nr:hypothetical protein [Cryobacterium sp. 1639]MBX0300267.1 hypothetical protein [Cryobacterium sp. 1639]
MATVVVAAGILLGTTGCNLYAPQATTIQYDASDGVSGDVGDLAIRNAILLTADGENANLLVHVVNSSTEDIELLVQYEGVDEKIDTEVTIEANSTTEIGVDGESVPVESLNASAGSLFPVFFQYGDLTGIELLVPVLDGELAEYSTLVPTEAPTPAQTSEPAETSEPTETPAATATPEATTAP